MHFGNGAGNFGGSAVRRPVGHDSAAAMSKLVALSPNYVQIVQNWSGKGAIIAFLPWSSSPLLVSGAVSVCAPSPAAVCGGGGGGGGDEPPALLRSPGTGNTTPSSRSSFSSWACWRRRATWERDGMVWGDTHTSRTARDRQGEHEMNYLVYSIRCFPSENGLCVPQ